MFLFCIDTEGSSHWSSFFHKWSITSIMMYVSIYSYVTQSINEMSQCLNSFTLLLIYSSRNFGWDSHFFPENIHFSFKFGKVYHTINDNKHNNQNLYTNPISENEHQLEQQHTSSWRKTMQFVTSDLFNRWLRCTRKVS